jgi:hypothetical protein
MRKKTGGMKERPSPAGVRCTAVADISQKDVRSLWGGDKVTTVRLNGSFILRYSPRRAQKLDRVSRVTRTDRTSFPHEARATTSPTTLLGCLSCTVACAYDWDTMDTIASDSVLCELATGGTTTASNSLDRYSCTSLCLAIRNESFKCIVHKAPRH